MRNRPDALCAELDGLGGAVGRAEVREQRHGRAVGERARRDGRRLERGALGDARLGLGDLLGRRSETTRSPAASTTTVSPSARLAASAAPTTATIDFSRARIAVCEVGPPSDVTSPSTWSRSSMAVSAGARSRATSTNGCPGFGTPGGGQLEQVRDRRAARCRRGRRPARPCTRPCRRAGRGTPRTPRTPRARRSCRWRGSFVTSSIRLGSSAIIACGLEHVLRRAAGLRPAVRELGRDDRQRRPGSLALTLGIEVAGPIDRFGQRIGHPNDRPHRDTLSDASAPDLHHSPSRFG